MSQSLPLSREVTAIRIPGGDSHLLPVGTEVVITQALGDTFTVAVPSLGGLFRIAGTDADALGRTAVTEAQALPEGQTLEEAAWEKLKNCYDPEIPVNIVDLGLVYTLEIAPDAEGKGSVISAQMTLTAPGCGMGPSIAADARAKLLTLPGVTEAQVAVVWDPPWGPDRITEAGKKKLGMV
ncbi:probable FeS assembly SUF system protein SufT [Verrucomicrobium sp. GAS474]|uniref:iron-sulfur cluster assembly protein n=1 Tax=Verrucomicrobium sp. GAS474 TaxID=1882831 RepID=UPI00087C43DD|nr:iron-sulfur cluster assembly protein [Verrucomicrobium sp. GAS474]SDU00157.1 probable FeS assembly SUF system protein SufT [Verrucomicrobium sp. GAS474]